MKVSIRGELHHMADSAILPLIDPAAMARIRTADDHPLFRAYAVAHEGAAHGRLIGVGKVALQYFRDVIDQIYGKLTLGTPFFMAHGKDNSHSGRIAVGELVGKSQQTINGVVHDIAVAYILPEHRDKVADVASIEAEEVLITDAGGERATAASVGAITGIALGNRLFDHPGFPGATLLAAVQAFAGETEKMTLEEMKAAIAAGGFTPSQLFAAETLTADPVVSESLAKERQTGVEARRRIQEDLGAKLDKERAEKEAALSQVSAVKADLTRTQAGKLFDALAAERKLPDGQAKYIRARLEKAALTGTDEAAVKAEIASITDDALKDYQAALDAAGWKPADAPPMGTPSSDGNPPLGDDGVDPFMDPKNNPLFQ